MCSKPISAHAEKGGSACSRPHTTWQRRKDLLSAGQVAPFTFAREIRSILLFSAPDRCAQVCYVARAVPVVDIAEGIHRQQLRNVFAGGQTGRYEWQDGSYTYRTTLLPLLGKDGQVEEVISVTRDISAWSTSAQSAQSLRDGTPPKTFAQILLAARETEKREVAKALHDEIGTASVMLAALTSITRQSVQKGDTAQALKDLERLQTQTQQSIERLRSIIVTLRPPSLEHDGALRGSLEELIKEVCRLGRIQYKFACAKQIREKGICDRVKILLYRLVQEALSNVVKHARASRVTVQLKRQKDTIYVKIQDDGVGFNPRKHLSIDHVGLRSMQDSVALLGGEFKMISAPGKGTCVEVACPCITYEENE